MSTLPVFEQLARDTHAVYNSGDPEALARLNRRYGRNATAADVRTLVFSNVYKVRQGGGAKPFTLEDAQAFIARRAGYGNWDALTAALLAGTAFTTPAWAFDPKENAISPRHEPTARDWDELLALLRDRQIPAFEANGCITDQALCRLADLPHITRLRLGGSRQLTDEGLQTLARFPQLEDLEISGNFTDRALEVLRHLPSLRRFQMTWQKGITDAGVSNLRHCPNLEVVMLMGTPTGDGLLEALQDKPRLHYLETGAYVTNAGLAHLAHYPSLTRLLLDGPITTLTPLEALPTLENLDLFWHVRELSTETFDVLPSLPNLTALGCDGKLSDDTAMRHIGQIPNLKNLRAQATTATEPGFLALSQSRTLEKLWTGRDPNNLTDRAFRALAQIPTLTNLGVSLANLSDAVLAELPNFPALTEITPIDLSDDGFRHLGHCPRLTRLCCMYCRETTDLATEHIAHLNLNSYYAGLTQITDHSLVLLSKMACLEALELFETRHISDEGLKHLVALPNLKELNLYGLPEVTLEGTQIFPPTVNVRYKP